MPVCSCCSYFWLHRCGAIISCFLLGVSLFFLPGPWHCIFRLLLASFLYNLRVLRVFLVWFSMFGVPILILLTPLLLESSVGRHLPLSGHQLPSTMLVSCLECPGISLATLCLWLSFLF